MIYVPKEWPAITFESVAVVSKINSCTLKKKTEKAWKNETRHFPLARGAERHTQAYTAMLGL